jgi:hypothetical protein
VHHVDSIKSLDWAFLSPRSVAKISCNLEIMTPHACQFCDSMIIRPTQTTETAKLVRFLFNCTLKDLRSSLAADCDFAHFIFKALDRGLERQSAEPRRASLVTGELGLFIKVFRSSNSHEIESVHSIGLLDQSKEEPEELCSSRSFNSDIDYFVMYATRG